MGDYTPAAVCRRGHVIATDLHQRPEEPKCSRCGAVVLRSCPACDFRIRGPYRSDLVASFGPYAPPSFCDHCGAAFPWASREARLFEIENRLEEDELSDADRLTLHEQLESLRSEELDEDQALERWQRVKKLVSPRVLDGAQQLILSVTSVAIQKKLGL